VDSVLRRAADLDAEGIRRVSLSSTQYTFPDTPQTAPSGDEPSLTAAEVVKLGAEAGLRSDLVAAALSELRRGTLVDETTDPVTRALGPSRLVVSRAVPGSAESASRAVERFLRDQLMTIRRHHGDRIEWERAVGVWPGLLRSLDFSKRYGFSLVDRIETRVFQDGADTVVTFHIDVGKMRRQRMISMGLRSAAAFALIGLGGAAAFPGFGAPDVVALGAGGLMAAGVAALERRRYLESRSRLMLAPERFLDLYVQRRRQLGSVE
jgi:hypothetical protein